VSEAACQCCSQELPWCLFDSWQRISYAVTELRMEPPGEDVDKLVLESLFEVSALGEGWLCVVYPLLISLLRTLIRESTARCRYLSC